VNKNVVLKTLAGLPDFRKAGGFYIGTCNRDVIAGYALDAPPRGLYVWRFVLPAYDRIELLHMTLGKRLAQFSRNEDDSRLKDLDLLLKNDWQAFSSVRDCKSLLTYMEQEQCVGDYNQWVRYLTHVKIGDLETASRFEDQWRSSQGFPRMQLIAENIKALREVKDQSGWTGVQRLLTEWSEHTVSKFCR
jgi:hypothetical protein